MKNKNQLFKFEYDCDELDHCKLKWTFFISKKENELIVEDLQIEEREEPKGCFGHPETIIALAKGRTISSFSTDNLLMAKCKNEISCGHFLAKCLLDIESKF
jgi:hypothetical protein